MSKTKTDVVKVEIGDLYQFLLAECRYGYKRNNHLMPGGAYDHVKEYLPLMYKTDKERALHTACQLCDECISDQLMLNFYDGLDDEYNNRAEALKFINYLLEWIHMNGRDISAYSNYDKYLPYNFNQYVENINKENSLKYRVFELDAFEETANKVKELTTESVTKEEADKILFTDELGITEGVMNHVSIKTKEYPVRVIGELIRIIEPESHKGKIYSIELVKDEKEV